MARAGVPSFAAAIVAAAAFVTAGGAQAAAPDVLRVGPVPVDFILFGVTLLGVALFHHHTLRVALIGLAAIVAYKVAFTGFKTGPGIEGLVTHLGHEWVILANLFLLLMGFALLSRHFEKSRMPGDPAAVPAGRLEGRLRAARHGVRSLVVPRQHRGRADRRRDGAPAFPRQGPHRLSRRDRRGVECGGRGQCHRRHDDHDDVDRGRIPACGVRSLRRGDGRARHLRHSRGEAAARVFTDTRARARARPRRLGARGHRGAHPCCARLPPTSR